MTAAVRIDKLLYFLRLVKTRSEAHELSETGYVRVNGRRVEKGSSMVHAEDIVTFPKGDAVFAVKLLLLPERRGSAVEARLCYQLLE
jgi:ribosome-associated heat shock protein Hsp15